MKAAVLFPAKQNHWVIAFPNAGVTSEQDRARMAEVWFRTWFADTYEDLRVTGSQVGKPSAIKANWISIDPDAHAYDEPSTVYVAIAFDYLGSADAIEWPAAGKGILYGIAQGVPTVHLKNRLEQEIDTIDRTIGDVSDDAGELKKKMGDAASLVMLGAVVGTGFFLFNAFGGRRGNR